MKLNRKAIMKGRGEFGFYVAVRIWDLLSFYSDKTFGVCFFLNSNSLYKCYFKLPYVYIIMSFEKKLCFFHFVIWEFLRQSHCL